MTLLRVLEQQDFTDNVYPFGEYHHLVLKDAEGEGRLKQFMQEHGDASFVAKPARPDIEDCFIELMKSG